MVPIDQIDPNPDQPRQAMGDLAELISSVAEKGIIEVADMPAAIAAIVSAVAEDDEARRQAAEEASAEGKPAPRGDGVTLRQRAWPLVEMMKRSHAAGNDIVWGV